MAPARDAVDPRRWHVLTLLLAAVVINYVDRGNLNITAVPVMKELGISPAGMGTLLSAFFWTYALAQIPSGYLADRYGLKWTYAAGFLLWSSVSIGIGLAQSLGQILVLRLLLGLAEAVAIPAGMAYIRRNFAPHEQGLPTGIFAAGAMYGPAVGTFLGSYLLTVIGWRWIFILTGAGALIWLLPWFVYAPAHRRGLLEQSTATPSMSSESWRFLRGNRLVWGITLGVFFYQYSFYFCLTWMPAYLIMERHYSFLSMGLFTGLPLLVMGTISILGGRASDLCARRFGSPLAVRRGFVAGGMLTGGIFILVLSQVESRFATGAAMLCAFAGIGIAGTNYWALTQLVCPSRLIGRVVGAQNTIGNIAGICAPLLTGVLVGREKNFQLAITLAGISLLFGALSYRFLIREQDHLEIQKRFHA
jgi:MFS family permease